MTIVASNLTAVAQNSAGTSYTTSSISPAAGALVIVSVASNVASSAVPTVTGASGTWVQIDTRVDGTNARRVTMFRDLSFSPGSGALTIDFAGVNQSNCAWSIDQFTGTDTSGTHGSGAIVQSVGNSTASGTTTAFNVTLAALKNSKNMAYGMVRQNTAAAITKGANLTALFNSGTALEVCSEYALNQTVVDWSWASQTCVSVGLAVEIKDNAPGAAASLDDYNLGLRILATRYSTALRDSSEPAMGGVIAYGASSSAAPPFVMTPDAQLPRASNYHLALESTTQPVLVIFPYAQTPNTYFEVLVTDDRPMRADIIGVALKATTAPIWPRAPPPTGGTPTPSTWLPNPDCTLPDWW